MKTKGEYTAAMRLVQESLREWDPYCLLAGGAPTDEFADEAARVVTYVPQMHSTEDAATFISSVFSASFEAHSFSPADCSGVGRALFDRLLKAGFVHAQQAIQGDGPASGGSAP
jgi:hypothetical protein